MVFAVVAIAFLGQFSGMFKSSTTERLLKGALSKVSPLGGKDEDTAEARATSKKSSSPKKLPEGRKPRDPAGE